MKVSHLKFDMIGAYLAGVQEHPQKVLKSLGIEYTHSTPQSVGDQWWFWNCQVSMSTLPEYITELDVDPLECVGFGLSEERALDISTQYEKLTNTDL